MRRVSIIPVNGCWMWMGSLKKSGYGLIRYDNDRSMRTKTMQAHRYAYILTRGPIPDGLELDHLCKQTWCVNPSHLEAVTPRVNVLRSDCPPAKNARKTHCLSGHPYDDMNTSRDKRGWRRCKACDRAKWHRLTIEQRREKERRRSPRCRRKHALGGSPLHAPTTSRESTSPGRSGGAP